jgi:hypothetical protein
LEARYATSSRLLRSTAGLIGLIQALLGLVFLLAPSWFATMLGLPPAPAWTGWILAMFGARALGFAYGMWLVMRDAVRHRAWIHAMIVIQALDWIATLAVVLRGVVTLAQVSTAAVLPIFFIAVLSLAVVRGRGGWARPGPQPTGVMCVFIKF